MEKEFTLGKTEEDMKENIYMIKSMDTEFIHGLMAENMMDNGKEGSNMEKENIYYQMDQ